MQAAFIILVALCAVFYLWRWKIDPLTVAFGSCVIYFVPGLYGSVSLYFGDKFPPYDADIAPMAYAVMATVILTLTAVTFAGDRISVGRPSLAAFDRYLSPVLLAIVLTFGAISIWTIGPFYLCGDKQDTLNHIDRWYYYAAYALPFAFVAAFCSRQWLIFSICFVIVLADVFIGFRSNAAIAFIGVSTVIGGWLFLGWRRALAFGAVILIGGASLMLVKQMTYNIKYASAPICTAALQAEKLSGADVGVNLRAAEGVGHMPPRPSVAEQMEFFGETLAGPTIYLNAIIQSEPFVIQSTLNEVVRQNFTTGKGYLLDQLLTGLPGGASIFRLDLGVVPTFGSIFQKALFPNADFGMASNPWAQAYAAGGLPFVFIFALGYSLIIAVFSYAFWKTEGALRGCISVAAAWLAFYFHRNDLLIEVGIMKQVVYTLLITLLLAWLMYLAPGQRAQNDEEPSASRHP